MRTRLERPQVSATAACHTAPEGPAPSLKVYFAPRGASGEHAEALW